MGTHRPVSSRGGPRCNQDLVVQRGVGCPYFLDVEVGTKVGECHAIAPRLIFNRLPAARGTQHHPLHRYAGNPCGHSSITARKRVLRRVAVSKPMRWWASGSGGDAASSSLAGSASRPAQCGPPDHVHINPLGRAAMQKHQHTAHSASAALRTITVQDHRVLGWRMHAYRTSVLCCVLRPT